MNREEMIIHLRNSRPSEVEEVGVYRSRFNTRVDHESAIGDLFVLVPHPRYQNSVPFRECKRIKRLLLFTLIVLFIKNLETKKSFV